jgi:hypothetical protein
VTAFRFPLDRVLAWRRSQLDAEQAEFRQRADAVAAIDRERAELEASGVAAEVQIRECRTLEGRDLEALARFRAWVRTRDSRLADERVARQRALGEQRTRMLEARRRCRLLERLKERRLAEWTDAAEKELEAFAAEAYLARWPARHDRAGS